MDPAQGGTATAWLEGSSLRDYLAVVRRRKWLIAQAVVLAPLAAFVVSMRQEPLYEATAEVLITRSSPSAAITGVADSGQPERTLQTQADIAGTPAVAARVVKALRLRDRTAEDLLAATSVAPRPNSDLLRFTLTDRDSGIAQQLATEYARQFTLYRRALDTAAIRRALTDARERLQALERRGEEDSSAYESLLEREQELATLETLLTSNASLVRPAASATRVRPKPLRNAALGLVLGLFLGGALAFIWDALDTRVRVTNEIERRIGLPLLARIPEPPRWIQRTGGLVMLASPNSIEAEAFRVLRTNLDFFNLEHGARVVMVTSAVQGEGKSTTVANLAVALARAGQRVVLVDLDLRQPVLDKFFGLQGSVGLTDVARGTAALAPAEPAESVDTPAGRLEVLTSGPLPENTGEFVGSPVLTEVLDELRRRADIVLIDSPPLLAVGDAMTLSAKVDGIIVLTRLNVVRRAMLDELRRILNNTPAAKLGFVVTGAEVEEEHRYGPGYGYRYVYGYGEPARKHAPQRRDS
jgi:capsular exopolysaccharide synthesis family protein